MSKHWIVVADQGRARFFTTASPRGALMEVATLDHAEARERTQELRSDRPGRSFDSAGDGRHAMSSPVDPKKQEAIRFAKQIAEYLQQAYNDGRCDELLLVAGPEFLGLLREQLNSAPEFRISEIEKNLGQYDPQEIRAHLPERL
ncbi:MAG: host attachment protein [Gammaproteobacteria bacterium]|jgi:protein required for attachment to host cells